MTDFDEDITYYELKYNLGRYCYRRDKAKNENNSEEYLSAALMIRYIREVQKMWKENERLTIELGRMHIKLRDKEVFQRITGVKRQ